MQQKENPSREYEAQCGLKMSGEKLKHCYGTEAKRKTLETKARSHFHLMEYTTNEFYSWQERNYFP